MAAFFVTPHPLGIVIVPLVPPGYSGELVIAGETYRGISFEELTRIATTTHTVDIESRRVPRP